MTRFGLSVLSCALLVSGCETVSQSTAAQGGALGAAVGAATGAVVGHQYGETGVGMTVGSGLGGAAGSIAGSALKAQAHPTPPTATPTVSSNQPTKFCPIGGELYPEQVKFCPIHGAELRRREPASESPAP